MVEPSSAIVGGATVGTVAGFLLIAFATLFCYRSKRCRKEKIEKHTVDFNNSFYASSPTSTTAYHTV